MDPEDITTPEELVLRLKPPQLTFFHIYPVVRNQVYQAVGDRGVRLDIVVHRPDSLTIYPNTSSVLHDPDEKLVISETDHCPSGETVATQL